MGGGGGSNPFANPTRRRGDGGEDEDLEDQGGRV